MNRETIPECTKSPDLWFSGNTAKQRQAIRICERCPLKTACLEMAVETKEEFGIWGATTPQEREDASSVKTNRALLCLNCKNKKPGTFEQVGTKNIGGARWVSPIIQCTPCGYQFTIAQSRWNHQQQKAQAA